jgi:hypothetical protein
VEDDQEITPAAENQPWQTWVFNQGNNETMELRRSNQVRRPNPKYAYVAIVVEEHVEPYSFNQANQSAE